MPSTDRTPQEVSGELQQLKDQHDVLIADIQQLQDEVKLLTHALSEKEAIINAISEHVVLQSPAQEIIWANKAAADAVGMPADQLIGRYCYDVWGGRSKSCGDCPIINTIETGCEHQREQSTQDGRVRLVRGYPVKDEDGRVIGAVETTRDITDWKTGQQQIYTALSEKDTLVREIHHRVKNNLAVVSSLLRLQSRRTTDEDHRQMFEDMEERVRSMALAHEMLYQSESLAEVEMKEYVDRLVRHLFTSVGILGQRINFKKEIGNVWLRLDRAVPLGCILTELISNSLKHAFSDMAHGEIVVALYETGNDGLELIVKDNGIGLPQDVDFARHDSFGLSLVRILAAQLGGSVHQITGKGTEIKLNFRGSY